MSKPRRTNCTLRRLEYLGIAAVMRSFCEEFGAAEESED